jgi:hypothetical protein
VAGEEAVRLALVAFVHLRISFPFVIFQLVTLLIFNTWRYRGVLVTVLKIDCSAMRGRICGFFLESVTLNNQVAHYCSNV